jgi:hypothetical protein
MHLSSRPQQQNHARFTPASRPARAPGVTVTDEPPVTGTPLVLEG